MKRTAPCDDGNCEWLRRKSQWLPGFWLKKLCCWIITLKCLKWFWGHLELHSNVGFVTVALGKFLTSLCLVYLFSKWGVIMLMLSLWVVIQSRYNSCIVLRNCLVQNKPRINGTTILIITHCFLTVKYQWADNNEFLGKLFLNFLWWFTLELNFLDYKACENLLWAVLFLLR